MVDVILGVACGYTSPLQGISRYAKTIHEAGCIGVACNSNQQFGAAISAGIHADATVLVMGLDQSMEAEALDRKSVLLPGHQQELISRVAMAGRGPTILVFVMVLLTQFIYLFNNLHHITKTPLDLYSGL